MGASNLDRESIQYFRSSNKMLTKTGGEALVTIWIYIVSVTQCTWTYPSIQSCKCQIPYHRMQLVPICGTNRYILVYHPHVQQSTSSTSCTLITTYYSRQMTTTLEGRDSQMCVPQWFSVCMLDVDARPKPNRLSSPLRDLFNLFIFPGQCLLVYKSISGATRVGYQGTSLSHH